MPPHQKLVTGLLAVFMVVLIVELVRKRRLREEYSWLWLLTAVGLAVVALSFHALEALTWLTGAGQPASAVFFLGLVFVTLLCLQFSVRLSRMTEQIKTLSQRLALFEMETKETREGEEGGED